MTKGPAANEPARKRASQARSLMTKQALITATIECLWERGYAGATISEISRKAEVTHGAHLHHFGTREELIAAAVDALFQRMIGEFELRFSKLPTDIEARTEAALDHFRDLAMGQLFGVVGELLNAARTDEGMASQMRLYGASQRMQQRQMYIKIFGTTAVDDPEVFYWLDTTFAIYLRGLSVVQATRTSREIDDQWQSWKKFVLPKITARLLPIAENS